jgi:palmitoyltransferase
LVVLNSISLFALSLLLGRSVWSLLWNTYAIEDWEIERHEVLLRRARLNGGYLDGPDGIQINIKRQEFPFDIGIWANITQGMGTANPLAWFWPFASTYDIHSGLEYETNGFEDPSIGWPPPDPDRIPRKMRRMGLDESYNDGVEPKSNEEELEAFRQRQAQDLKRWEAKYEPLRRRQPFHQRYDKTALQQNDMSSPNMYVEGEGEGEESWRDNEGQALHDFGVDEEAEFYDEEDLPLAELMRRRRQKRNVD